MTRAVLTAVAGAAAMLVVAGGLAASESAVALVRDVTERASVTGRVSGETFRLPLRVFEYLLDHPELTTQVTQALKIGPYRVWREAGGLRVDDGAGAVGDFSIVSAAAGRRVVYLRGHYKKGAVPAIHGRAVAILEYTARPAPDGRALITPTITGFLRIDNAVIDMLSRILRPVAAAKAERLARRVVGDFAKTARAIDADPAHVHDELRRRPEVRPDELEALRRLLDLP
ncbi:MAG: hypothetical protein WED01_15440 [Candidatus Rokuibacteriota bacterium]